MKLLLDTHALLWWTIDDARLPPKARAALQDEANAVFFSVASIWEIGIKFGRGKLPDAGQLIADLRKGTALPHFTLLPITPEHAIEAGCAQIAHRDPFDRMLVCQARLEGLTIVSNERVFDGFGVARLWD